MKDAYYFSHDSNARNDTKILSMRCDYGLEGYGMYWMIIETLRDETEYKLKLNNNTYRALAMQMHCKSDAVKKFIEDCINEYDLFKSDDEYFWAESLLRRMEKVEDIREKRKQAAEKRWNKEKGMQEDSTSNANALQDNAKERKGKERKRNIYSDFITSTIKKYPGKKVKSVRDKKLPKIIEEYGEEQISRCIDRYVEEVKGSDKRFILNESTFWNGRYMDYLDENYQEADTQEKPIGVPPSESVLGEREESWY